MTTRIDPLTAAPHVYSAQIENSRVRVLNIRLAPGALSELHDHPDRVLIVLAPARVRFTGPDGATVEKDLAPGPLWQDAQSHAVENIGAADVRAVLVELK